MKAGILIASLAFLIAITAGSEMVSMRSQLELAEPVAPQEEPPLDESVSGLNKLPSGSTDDNLENNKKSDIGIGQPKKVNPLSATTDVYIGGTTIPLSSYQTTYGKYLLIESDIGLRQYASINQYSSLSLIAYTSTTGPGEILEMYPSESNRGIYQRTLYSFNPGYNRIPYRGDVVGRHYLLFTTNDESSNAIIIDVIAYRN